MAEVLAPSRLDFDTQPFEQGLPSGRCIRLRKLVDHYYPSGIFPDNGQILDKIAFISSVLPPRGRFSVAAETVLPVLGMKTLQCDDNQYLTLDLVARSESDSYNAHSYLLEALKGNPQTFKPVVVNDRHSATLEGADVFRMGNDKDRIEVFVGGKREKRERKTTYIIMQPSYTALAESYFALKIVVFDDSECEGILDFSGSRTLFEMRVLNENESYLRQNQRLNLDRIRIPWIHTEGDPYALVTDEFMDALREPFSVEMEDLLQSADPGDNIDLLMVTARMVYLASLIGERDGRPLIRAEIAARIRDAISRFAVTTREVPGFSAMDQIVYQLKKRGEDYHDEADEFRRTMVKAYYANRDVFIKTLKITGLEKMFPLFAKENFSDPHTQNDVFDLFNPLSGISLEIEAMFAKAQLKTYAYYMHYTFTIAREYIEKFKDPYVCIVLKDGKMVTYAYYRKNSPSSSNRHVVEQALVMAAEKLNDPNLSGCDVVTLRGPDNTDILAINQYNGVKSVVYSLANPDLTKEDTVKFLDQVSPSPFVIEGMLKRQALRFIRERTGYSHLAATSPRVNHDGEYAVRYIAETRAQTEQSGSIERAKIESHLVSDLTGYTILDAGCRNGDDAFWLFGKGAAVRGIDISPEYIRKAKTDHREIARDFQQGNITELPYENGFFDVIIAKYVLNEIQASEIERVYAEFYRCLKPGGKLILFFHHPMSQMLLPEVMTGAVKPDYFSERIVEVQVYDGVTIHEPTHTLTDILTPLYRKFRVDETDEMQDTIKIHPDKNIPEILFIAAHKE